MKRNLAENTTLHILFLRFHHAVYLSLQYFYSKKLDQFTKPGLIYLYLQFPTRNAQRHLVFRLVKQYGKIQRRGSDPINIYA